MHREDIAWILMWISLAFFGISALTYFFLLDIINWQIPFGLGVAIVFVWAYLLSTPSQPRELTVRLRQQNSLTGQILVKSDAIVVGDKWNPGRNDFIYELVPGEYRYEATVENSTIVRFQLFPCSLGREFCPIVNSVPVDSGFLAFIDSDWERRNVSPKEIEQNVLAILSSDEPLSLRVNDSSGKSAGVVVSSGLGDGTYSVIATRAELSVSFT